MTNRDLIIFASGSKDGGGSGFENLVDKISANIRFVVSNHENGGVRQRAEKLGIEFRHMPPPYDVDGYKKIIADSSNNVFIALSGWIKKVEGLPPNKTINIHPGPVDENLAPELIEKGVMFSGKGMYGDNVHEAILDAYRKGFIKRTCITMHFVTEEYDKGPIIFQIPVPIEPDDTLETLKARVNKMEHTWQPYVTAKILDGSIDRDGENPDTIEFPNNYQYSEIVSLV